MAAAFDLQAHRGGRGLTPESTLAGFKNAIALGVTTLETDLAVTKDDVLVLSHEPRLNPDLVRGPDGEWIDGWPHLDVRALYEGDEIAPREPVLTIEGDYALFAHLETVYLGCLARRSRVQPTDTGRGDDGSRPGAVPTADRAAG